MRPKLHTTFIEDWVSIHSNFAICKLGSKPQLLGEPCIQEKNKCVFSLKWKKHIKHWWLVAVIATVSAHFLLKKYEVQGKYLMLSAKHRYNSLKYSGVQVDINKTLINYSTKIYHPKKMMELGWMKLSLAHTCRLKTSMYICIIYIFYIYTEKSCCVFYAFVGMLVVIPWESN